jgi:hypothetical protein
VATLESAAFAARHGSRPVIRRLCALWIDRLQSCTGSRVRLELAENPFGDNVVTGSAGVIVAALSWRDPSLF